MAILNSYVKLPEGIHILWLLYDPIGRNGRKF